MALECAVRSRLVVATAKECGGVWVFLLVVCQEGLLVLVQGVLVQWDGFSRIDP